MSQWPPVEVIALTWISDSGKRESIHRNGPGMTADESYLGHLHRVQEGEEWAWGYYWRGEPDFKRVGSYPRARKALESRAWEAVK